ncbi:MAG: hypothetical protein Q4B60_07035 [Erysipelotrichaceae bacterium]|nr:hypothetical protein [Erysipelotrichaceae bacterium]
MFANIRYYLTAFLTGITIIPLSGVTGISLLLAGVLCPLAAFIKLLGKIFGYDLPIGLFSVASLNVPIIIEVLLTILISLVFLYFGKLLLSICKRYLTWIRKCVL